LLLASSAAVFLITGGCHVRELRRQRTRFPALVQHIRELLEARHHLLHGLNARHVPPVSGRFAHRASYVFLLDCLADASPAWAKHSAEFLHLLHTLRPCLHAKSLTSRTHVSTAAEQGR
jgi:hypothetical protein